MHRIGVRPFEMGMERRVMVDGSGDTEVARQIKVVGFRIDSRDLFDRTREVTIQHNDDEYRLRLTGNGKLILTK